MNLSNKIALTGVSCTSSSFCIAVDESGGAFEFNGTNWTAGTSWTNPIDSTHIINGISCYSTTFCIAVDSGGNSLNYTGGSTWTSTAINPPSTPDLTAVSCISTTFCAVVDSSANAYVGHPGSWTTSAVGGAGFISVGCATSTLCVDESWCTPRCQHSY